MATSGKNANLTPRRRRWPWILALLLALLWLLPTIVARTTLLNRLIHSAVGPLEGELHVGGASLGWFSPIALEDVALRDRHGNTILSVKRLSSTKRLWHFLWNRTNLGVIRLEGANVDLAVRNGGSNIEDALAPLWKPRAASGPGPSVVVEVKGATIRLSSQGGLASTINANATLAVNTNPRIPLELQAQLAGDSGDLTAHVIQHLDQSPYPWLAKVDSRAFPVGALTPVLHRLGLTGSVHGTATGSLSLAWRSDAGPFSARLDADLQVAAASLLIDGLAERIDLADVRLPCRIIQEGSRLTIEKLDLACALGTLKCQGSLDAPFELDRLLRRPGLALELDVDLSQVARRLPRTLRLHDDLAVDQGRLTLALKSKAAGDEVAWTLSVLTRDLAGKRGARTVSMPEAVRASLAVRLSDSGWPIVDRLDLTSKFLSLEGRGNAEKTRIDGRADLARLSALLEEFVDVRDARLRGEAVFHVDVRRRDGEHYQVDAGLTAKDWELSWAGFKPWREEEATWKLDFLARHHRDRLSIITARAALESGPDKAQALLLAPLPSFDLAGAGAWDIFLSGDLARWQRRIELVSGPWSGWRLAGVGDVRASLVLEAEKFKTPKLNILAKDLRLQGPGLWISETAVDLEARGHFTTAGLACDQLQVRCPTVNLNAAGVTFDWRAMEAAAGLSLAANLSRARQWFLDPAEPAPMPVTGTAVGQVGLRWKASRLTFDANLTLDELSVGPPARPHYRDQKLKLQARGGLDLAVLACQLDTLRLESKLLTCLAKGRVGARGDHVDLRGRLVYDLKQLTPMLQPYLGKDVEIDGQGERDFFLSGEAGAPKVVLGGKDESALSHLRGEAGLHWAKLKAFHCDVGPAELKAGLSKGEVSLAPIETSINAGKLRLAPRLRLDPAELTLPASVAIERAHLTPALCNDALAFALPALAGVTEVEGLLSLHLDHARMPLADPTAADIKGTLILHDAKLGPTPMLRELGRLFKGPAPARLKKETQVPIHMTKGKVHHQQLELVFPDVTIRTSGWVGMDGALAIVAEMPIPPSWVGADRLGKALEGQLIRIPIRGTLASPQLDQKALQAAVAQFLRDSAGAALRNELEDRLKKLLKGK